MARHDDPRERPEPWLVVLFDTADDAIGDDPVSDRDASRKVSLDLRLLNANRSYLNRHANQTATSFGRLEVASSYSTILGSCQLLELPGCFRSLTVPPSVAITAAASRTFEWFPLRLIGTSTKERARCRPSLCEKSTAIVEPVN